jgi:hypothetical protein
MDSNSCGQIPPQRTLLTGLCLSVLYLIHTVSNVNHTFMSYDEFILPKLSIKRMSICWLLLSKLSWYPNVNPHLKSSYPFCIFIRQRPNLHSYSSKCMVKSYIKSDSMWNHIQLFWNVWIGGYYYIFTFTRLNTLAVLNKNG